VSLRTRIAAAAGVAVAVAIVASAALVYIGVRSELRAEVRRSLETRAQGLLIAAPGRGRGGPGGGRPPRGGAPTPAGLRAAFTFPVKRSR
jgi:hypothetical protein